MGPFRLVGLKELNCFPISVIMQTIIASPYLDVVKGSASVELESQIKFLFLENIDESYATHYHFGQHSLKNVSSNGKL